MFDSSVRLAQVSEQLDAVAGIAKGARGCCGRFRAPASNVSQPCHRAIVIRNDHAQNADFPRNYSEREKKPFAIPVLELRRRARERMKKAEGKPKRPLPPPKNGMLVNRLIPVAYSVYNARIMLINNLKRLMKVVPVKGCKYTNGRSSGGLLAQKLVRARLRTGDDREQQQLRTVEKLYIGSNQKMQYSVPLIAKNSESKGQQSATIKDQRYCSEIHVGSVGHPFRTCRGMSSDQRRGEHDWGSTLVEAVFLPVEAYHLEDRLGKRIPHDRRFAVSRIPALVELCIQAGVDLPEPEPDRFKQSILQELPYDEIIAPLSPEETAALAAETLKAWETVRDGALKLMKSYAVRVCGYCPEVHIGPSGHKARNCGAFKHQQRNGQHGWQAAVLDDLIPPRYVWHMPESGEELQRELKSFYGQAPAVVEICIQAGAKLPEKYKATMRLDIGIPASLREAEMVV